jgi:hypothetical protein
MRAAGATAIGALAILLCLHEQIFIVFGPFFKNFLKNCQGAAKQRILPRRNIL